IAREHPRAHAPTDPVIRVVAEDRRDVEQKAEPIHVQAESLRGEQTGRYQQRVARQEETEKQPRLDEDDRSESNISGPLDERGKVSKAAEQVRQEFHCGKGKGK